MRVAQPAYKDSILFLHFQIIFLYFYLTFSLFSDAAVNAHPGAFLLADKDSLHRPFRQFLVLSEQPPSGGVLQQSAHAQVASRHEGPAQHGKEGFYSIQREDDAHARHPPRLHQPSHYGEKLLLCSIPATPRHDEDVFREFPEAAFQSR